jgi:hypothetical protein
VDFFRLREDFLARPGFRAFLVFRPGVVRAGPDFDFDEVPILRIISVL